ncbi:MAG: ribosome-binding factor A [bacterium]|nr:ribosome-binding factor A [bacterium]
MPLQRRLDKINELIHRFVADLLRKELDTDALVTISSVTTTGNVQDCSIGITVFPFEKSKAVLKEIEKNIYEIQQKLNQGLKMRPVPKITFKIDESQEKGDKILRVMDKIEIKEED